MSISVPRLPLPTCRGAGTPGEMKVLRFLLPLGVAGLGLLGWSYWTAVSDPVVRHGEVALLSGEAAERS